VVIVVFAIAVAEVVTGILVLFIFMFPWRGPGDVVRKLLCTSSTTDYRKLFPCILLTAYWLVAHVSCIVVSSFSVYERCRHGRDLVLKRLEDFRMAIPRVGSFVMFSSLVASSWRQHWLGTDDPCCLSDTCDLANISFATKYTGPLNMVLVGLTAWVASLVWDIANPLLEFVVRSGLWFRRVSWLFSVLCAVSVIASFDVTHHAHLAVGVALWAVASLFFHGRYLWKAVRVTLRPGEVSKDRVEIVTPSVLHRNPTV